MRWEKPAEAPPFSISGVIILRDAITLNRKLIDISHDHKKEKRIK